MDLGVLEILVKEDDVGGGTRTGWWSSKDLRERGRAGSLGRTRRGQREGYLAARHACIGQRIEYRGVDDSAVIDAIASTQHGFSLTKHVKGKADARPKIVLVFRHIGRLGES